MNVPGSKRVVSSDEASQRNDAHIPKSVRDKSNVAGRQSPSMSHSTSASARCGSAMHSDRVNSQGGVGFPTSALPGASLPGLPSAWDFSLPFLLPAMASQLMALRQRPFLHPGAGSLFPPGLLPPNFLQPPLPFASLYPPATAECDVANSAWSAHGVGSCTGSGLGSTSSDCDITGKGDKWLPKSSQFSPGIIKRTSASPAVARKAHASEGNVSKVVCDDDVPLALVVARRDNVSRCSSTAESAACVGDINYAASVDLSRTPSIDSEISQHNTNEAVNVRDLSYSMESSVHCTDSSILDEMPVEDSKLTGEESRLCGDPLLASRSKIALPPRKRLTRTAEEMDAGIQEPNYSATGIANSPSSAPNFRTVWKKFSAKSNVVNGPTSHRLFGGKPMYDCRTYFQKLAEAKQAAAASKVFIAGKGKGYFHRAAGKTSPRAADSSSSPRVTRSQSKPKKSQSPKELMDEVEPPAVVRKSTRKKSANTRYEEYDSTVGKVKKAKGAVGFEESSVGTDIVKDLICIAGIGDSFSDTPSKSASKQRRRGGKRSKTELSDAGTTDDGMSVSQMSTGDDAMQQINDGTTLTPCSVKLSRDEIMDEETSGVDLFTSQHAVASVGPIAANIDAVDLVSALPPKFRHSKGRATTASSEIAHNQSEAEASSNTCVNNDHLDAKSGLAFNVGGAVDLQVSMHNSDEQLYSKQPSVRLGETMLTSLTEVTVSSSMKKEDVVVDNCTVSGIGLSDVMTEKTKSRSSYSGGRKSLLYRQQLNRVESPDEQLKVENQSTEGLFLKQNAEAEGSVIPSGTCRETAAEGVVNADRLPDNEQSGRKLVSDENCTTMAEESELVIDGDSSDKRPCQSELATNEADILIAESNSHLPDATSRGVVSSSSTLGSKNRKKSKLAVEGSAISEKMSSQNVKNSIMLDVGSLTNLHPSAVEADECTGPTGSMTDGSVSEAAFNKTDINCPPEIGNVDSKTRKKISEDDADQSHVHIGHKKRVRDRTDIEDGPFNAVSKKVILTDGNQSSVEYSNTDGMCMPCSPNLVGEAGHAIKISGKDSAVAIDDELPSKVANSSGKHGSSSKSKATKGRRRKAGVTLTEDVDPPSLEMLGSTIGADPELSFSRSDVAESCPEPPLLELSRASCEAVELENSLNSNCPLPGQLLTSDESMPERPASRSSSVTDRSHSSEKKIRISILPIENNSGRDEPAKNTLLSTKPSSSGLKLIVSKDISNRTDFTGVLASATENSKMKVKENRPSKVSDETTELEATANVTLLSKCKSLSVVLEKMNSSSRSRHKETGAQRSAAKRKRIKEKNTAKSPCTDDRADDSFVAFDTSAAVSGTSEPLSQKTTHAVVTDEGGENCSSDHLLLHGDGSPDRHIVPDTTPVSITKSSSKTHQDSPGNQHRKFKDKSSKTSKSAGKNGDHKLLDTDTVTLNSSESSGKRSLKVAFIQGRDEHQSRHKKHGQPAASAPDRPNESPPVPTFTSVHPVVEACVDGRKVKLKFTKCFDVKPPVSDYSSDNGVTSNTKTTEYDFAVDYPQPSLTAAELAGMSSESTDGRFKTSSDVGERRRQVKVEGARSRFLKLYKPAVVEPSPDHVKCRLVKVGRQKWMSVAGEEGDEYSPERDSFATRDSDDVSAESELMTNITARRLEDSRKKEKASKAETSLHKRKSVVKFQSPVKEKTSSIKPDPALAVEAPVAELVPARGGTEDVHIKRRRGRPPKNDSAGTRQPSDANSSSSNKTANQRLQPVVASTLPSSSSSSDKPEGGWRQAKTEFIGGVPWLDIETDDVLAVRTAFSFGNDSFQTLSAELDGYQSRSDVSSLITRSSPGLPVYDDVDSGDDSDSLLVVTALQPCSTFFVPTELEKLMDRLDIGGLGVRHDKSLTGLSGLTFESVLRHQMLTNSPKQVDMSIALLSDSRLPDDVVDRLLCQPSVRSVTGGEQLIDSLDSASDDYLMFGLEQSLTPLDVAIDVYVPLPDRFFTDDEFSAVLLPFKDSALNCSGAAS